MLTDDEIDALWSHIETIDTAEAGRVLVRTAISAVLEKLTAGVAVPDLYRELREGYIDEDGEPFVCLTKGQASALTDKLSPLIYAYGASQRLAGQQRGTCTWTEQDDQDMPGTYESSCGEIWSFIDGGVKENRVTYCHHCGGKVVPASPQEQT